MDDDDMLADGLDYAEELRRKRLSLLRDEDGNLLHDFDDEDNWEPDEATCAVCHVKWGVEDIDDLGLCPECREVENE